MFTNSHPKIREQWTFRGQLRQENVILHRFIFWTIFISLIFFDIFGIFGFFINPQMKIFSRWIFWKTLNSSFSTKFSLFLFILISGTFFRFSWIMSVCLWTFCLLCIVLGKMQISVLSKFSGYFLSKTVCFDFLKLQYWHSFLRKLLFWRIFLEFF